MREPLPWLAQGDIFADVPIVSPRVAADSHGLSHGSDHGPAMLITHDCSLDKANGRGRATIRRLFFLPLRAVATLQPDRASMLRHGELAPFESLYLGEVSDFGETYVVMSEAYYLPAEYFSVELEQFNHLDPKAGARRLVATVNCDRAGSVDDLALALFQKKWIAFWTRLTEV